MKKARLNYWVDMVTGAAFLCVAVTGVVRMFPEAASVSSSGTPVILGISSTVWTTIHDWSGVVMAAGVGLHTILHFNWLVRMTRSLFKGERRQRIVREPAPAESRAVLARATSPTDRSPAAASPLPRRDEAAYVDRLTAMSRPEPRRHLAAPGDESPRISRKTFLAGAALGGAALLVGAGVIHRGLSSADISTTSIGADNGYGNGSGGSASSSSSAGASSGDGATSGGSTAAARVSVDTAACAGCGSCVQVCPHGVFTMNGSAATAASPDSCSLCGHCVQVCRPQAITLSG